MAIHGFPGGVISATAPTISPSGASGVWTLDDQLQAGANWPVAPALATNSVRFRSSASAFLNRTFATTGNRKIWTYSAWIKRGAFSADMTLLCQYTDGNNQSLLAIRNSSAGTNPDRIRFYDLAGGSFTSEVIWTPVYRDPSAWYHLVLQVDTTQATSSNRIRLYINGSQVTETVAGTYPAQNVDLRVNFNGPHFIGQNGANNQYADGYLTEVNFIDGQALTPNYFGATNPSTGAWQPATYRGTYGTNGFYLPMSIDAPTYQTEYFVLGGGSGGSRAAAAGGGGGGGGYTTSSTLTVSSLTTYAIVVGGGGAGATAQTTKGAAGSASSITQSPTVITANGGTNTITIPGNEGYGGLNGGSGGGGGAGSVIGNGGTDGGDGVSGIYGGGLGQGTTTRAFGGTLYAGGGGGGGGSAFWGGNPTGGTGGAGGGANGGNDSVAGSSASANTGGGGGGGGGNQAITGTNGGAGGSGIVIIRYLGAQRGSGGTVTSAGGYTIHTFTSSGTYTA
jgi:hypothetical protein